MSGYGSIIPGARNLRVLVVTTGGEKRLADLKRWTEAETGGDLLWFTTLREAEPQKVLSQAIWRVAGSSAAYVLAT